MSKIADHKIRQLWLLRQFNMTDKTNKEISEEFEEEFNEEVDTQTISKWRVKFKKMEIGDFRRKVDQLHQEKVENKRLLISISNKVLKISNDLSRRYANDNSKKVKTSDIKNLARTAEILHRIHKEYDKGKTLEPERKIEKELEL